MQTKRVVALRHVKVPLPWSIPMLIDSSVEEVSLSLSSFRPNKVLSPTDDSVGNNEVARCVTTESRSLFSPEEKEIKTQ